MYLAVTMSRFSNKDAAIKAGYKENTYYSHIKQEFLDYSILEKYGRAIGYDFSVEYPEMAEYFPDIIQDTISKTKDFELLQNKYLALLEKHKDLMEKYSDLQEKVITLEQKGKR